MQPSPICPDCESAKLRMKEQGFRNWRAHACYEHAAVSLDEWMTRNGHVDTSEKKS